MHLVITYFHQITGPSVLVSYPDQKLEEDLISKLIKFFDLEIDETFFEIVLITKKKKIINFHFEIESEWARGNKEFAMLSLIMKKKYESEQFYAFLVDASYKILKTENVYKAFYKESDFHYNDIEIDLNYEIIRKILFNCLTSLISRIEDRIKGVNKKQSFPFS
jgi:3'-phosphoadenosine 5'-phosphosulfate sulfotransferase (PAPS reductase)/FAD synthetase